MALTRLMQLAAVIESVQGTLEGSLFTAANMKHLVIDPVMNRVLKRSGNAPYDYVGKTADMGKVPAMAALLDCTDERINRIREFGGIEDDVFISDDAALALPAIGALAEPKNGLQKYCEEQISMANTIEERQAAVALQEALNSLIRSRPNCDA